MPKDFTGVRPLGVLTRHPADWFSDSLYTISFTKTVLFSGAGNQYMAFAVFNNDNIGRVMKVYGYSATCDGGGGLATRFAPARLFTPVNTATSIRPDLPAPTVTISFDSQVVPPGGLTPYDTGQQCGLLGTFGFDSGTAFAPFPLFIIPTGWSLVGFTSDSCQIAAMCLWFQMAPQ
jgi:hypothetical protein